MREEKERTLCGSRIFALIWRFAVMAGGLFGISTMVFGGKFSSQLLCYFTIQSNILIALLFAVLFAGTLAQLVRGERGGELYHVPEWLQLGIIFFVQITFIVYASMLSGTSFTMGNSVLTIGNLLLHYAVPLAALADWVLFMPHGRVGYRHAALWLLYPAAYVAFAFIRAALGQPFAGGSRFPYFFMDADALGWNTIWVCAAFFAAFFALGCLLTLIDKLLAAVLRRLAK